MSAASVVDWKQNIVAAFTKPFDRKRQLIFDSMEKLDALMNSEDFMAQEADLLAQADTGHVDPTSSVVAEEPAEYINSRDQLYLMLILSFSESFHPMNTVPNIRMETASILLHEAAP